MKLIKNISVFSISAISLAACTAIKAGASRAAAEGKPYRTTLTTAYDQTKGECTVAQVSQVLSKWGNNAVNQCKTQGFENCRVESISFGSGPEKSKADNFKNLCHLEVTVAGIVPAGGKYPVQNPSGKENPSSDSNDSTQM